MDDIANDEVKHPPQLENTTPESLIKFTYAGTSDMLTTTISTSST